MIFELRVLGNLLILELIFEREKIQFRVACLLEPIVGRVVGRALVSVEGTNRDVVSCYPAQRSLLVVLLYVELEAIKHLDVLKLIPDFSTPVD